MAEMSPIDVLRRYQEYETELAPPAVGAAHPPEASLKTYAFVEEVKSLPPDQAQPCWRPFRRPRGSFACWCRAMAGSWRSTCTS